MCLQITPHHIGLTVKNINETIEFMKKFGFSVEKILRNEERKLTLAFLKTNSLRIELYQWDSLQDIIEPFNKPGYHHIAFKVNNIEETIRVLQKEKKCIKFLISPKEVLHKNLLNNTYEKRRIAFVEILEGTIFEFFEEWNEHDSL